MSAATFSADPASFRDPSGTVFHKDGRVFRDIYAGYAANYTLLMKSGLYTELIALEWLIPHVESISPAPASPSSTVTIQPELIPFISYPYEWSFSQLKDAALLTLNIQKIALSHGMTLKDASAYNVQFLRGKPIFIDTLSFEKYSSNTPWVAYKQFCQHFLAPLVLASKKDLRLTELLTNNIDGIPLDLCTALLPRRSIFNLGIFSHIYLHAASQKRYEDPKVSSLTKTFKVSPSSLLGIIDSLSTTINNLKFRANRTEWGNYYTNTNYTSKAFIAKSDIVTKFLTKCAPKLVWDVGANSGEFSKIATSLGAYVVATDIDAVAIEKLYTSIRLQKDVKVLPLLVDVTNPSPGIGWHNSERASFLNRIQPNLIMALALIHHLAISNNIPLPKLATFFAEKAPWLLIEFVPKDDTQVQKLLFSRKDIFTDYTQEKFETYFSTLFTIIEKEVIPGTKRTLYLLKKK